MILPATAEKNGGLCAVCAKETGGSPAAIFTTSKRDEPSFDRDFTKHSSTIGELQEYKQCRQCGNMLSPELYGECSTCVVCRKFGKFNKLLSATNDHIFLYLDKTDSVALDTIITFTKSGPSTQFALEEYYGRTSKSSWINQIRYFSHPLHPIEARINAINRIVDKRLISKSDINLCSGKRLFRILEIDDFGECLAIDGSIILTTSNTSLTIEIKIGNRSKAPQESIKRAKTILSNENHLLSIVTNELKAILPKISYINEAEKVDDGLLDTLLVRICSSKKQLADLFINSYLDPEHGIEGRLIDIDTVKLKSISRLTRR